MSLVYQNKPLGKRQIADAVRLADQAQRLDLTTYNQKVLPESEVKTTEVKDTSEYDDEKKTKKFKLWPFG